MSKKLESLLQFRFQRQTNPKLQTKNLSLDSQDISETSSSGSAPVVIPESPVITIDDRTPTPSPVPPEAIGQSQAATTVSPHSSQTLDTQSSSASLQPTHNATKRIILDSDDEEPAARAADVARSPAWLSKDTGKTSGSNGGETSFSENNIRDRRRLCRRVISVCSSDEEDAPCSASSQSVSGEDHTSIAKKRSLEDEDAADITGNARKRIRMMSSSDSEHTASLPPTPAKSDPPQPPLVTHAKATRANTDVEAIAQLPDKLLDDETEDPDMDDSGDEKCDSQTDVILSFFETATLGEIAAMPSSSKKRAELIIGQRPFETYENLMARFSETKGLSVRIISGCWEIIQVRETVVRLMARCEKISERLESVVGRLASGATLSEVDGLVQQPGCLSSGLHLQPYQLVGLTWLREMHTQAVDGILADEMGLGKTIQAISFLAYLFQDGRLGPHVIIVPASVMANWERELEKWCPCLTVCVYYGSQDERRAIRQRILQRGIVDFHILLTTYSMATGSIEDRSLFKKCTFHYAIFDEGHLLKNMSSQRYQYLMKIQAERRLLLTGTPLQNNLLELISLLSFVVPHIFMGKTEHLKKIFTTISKGDEARGSYERERIAHAKKIMHPFVLRRLKKEVLDQLPKKTEVIKACRMIPDQEELYDRVRESVSREVTEDSLSAETLSTKVGLSLLMRLRKVANHPLLQRNLFDDEDLVTISHKIAKEPSHLARNAIPEIIREDMQEMSDFELHKLCIFYRKEIGSHALDVSLIEDSGKFRMLDTLLPKMKKQGDRVLLFSQFTMMLDIIEEFLTLRDMKYLRLDGSTPVPDRLQMIDKFNQDASIFIFLLSTRAGGLGINLTSANKVIIHDIDYNPYNDRQAEDRCHRLGQTREVEVIKFISVGTIEEAMSKSATYKLQLERDITHNHGNHDDEDQIDKKDMTNLLRQALLIEKDRSVSKNTILTDSVIGPRTENSSTPKLDSADDSIFPKLDDINDPLGDNFAEIRSKGRGESAIDGTETTVGEKIENGDCNEDQMETDGCESGAGGIGGCVRDSGVEPLGDVNGEPNGAVEVIGDCIEERVEIKGKEDDSHAESRVGREDAGNDAVVDLCGGDEAVDAGKVDESRVVENGVRNDGGDSSRSDVIDSRSDVVDLCLLEEAGGTTSSVAENGEHDESAAKVVDLCDVCDADERREDRGSARSNGCVEDAGCGDDASGTGRLWVDLTMNGDSADSYSGEKSGGTRGSGSVIDIDGSSNDTLNGVEPLPAAAVAAGDGVKADSYEAKFANACGSSSLFYQKSVDLT